MTEQAQYAKWVEVAAGDLVLMHDMDEIEIVLVQRGCPASLVEKLLLFIPSAFAAEHYEVDGIPFPKTFFVGPVGHFREMSYANEPVYVEARRIAARWIKEGKSSLIGRVLDWSAEAKGIEKAKSAGLTPLGPATVHHGFAQ